MMEKRYVISELHPISVLDMNTGDTYPITDGEGFVEKVCELLNEQNETIQELIKEGKYQQGQKQRLANYLRKNGLSDEQIREIANNDKWLNGDYE